MLIANAVIGMRRDLHCQLAVGRGQWNQLAAGQLFRRATFIRINVRKLRTQHRMIGPRQRLQAQHIRRGSVENKENLDVLSKMLAKFSDGRLRVGIISIPHYMTFIRASNRLQHLGMNNRIVVAGKTSHRFHNKTI